MHGDRSPHTSYMVAVWVVLVWVAMCTQHSLLARSSAV